MSERPLSEKILILETCIKERSLIIYVIESDLRDMCYPKEYAKALKDEIKNHKIAIKEYKQGLKQFKKK